MRRLLGPGRVGLANRLLEVVDHSVLEDAVWRTLEEAANGRIRNPAGYLCRVVGYRAVKGGSDAEKREGRRQPARRNK